MIEIGSDVVVSGKINGWVSTYSDEIGETCTIYDVILRSGDRIRVRESDIKSYHPYQPIPEVDERKGQ